MTTMDDIRESLRECNDALVQYERAVANDAPAKRSPGLLIRAQQDIEFLFGNGGTRVQRSTFGAMLEQAELFAFAKGDDGVVRPVAARTPDCIPIKHQREEPGYELDLREYETLGRASTLLRMVERRCSVFSLALRRYYGDAGAHWARPATPDRSGGVGDRGFALYAMTPMGRKWVAQLRAKSPLSEHLSPDELLAAEWAMHKSSPTDDMRRQRLMRCTDDARLLLNEAHLALEMAAIEQSDTAKQIRATGRRMAA
jgi:hypothetical protein